MTALAQPGHKPPSRVALECSQSCALGVCYLGGDFTGWYWDRRIDMNSEQLEGAKKLFFILLGIDIAATAIVGFNAFSTVGTLREVQSGARNIDQSMISSLEFWDGFSKLLILTLIGVGLGLVKWLNACYSFAKQTIGATGFKNEGWTAAGWIIPIFNLFKPYQIINEIYKAGSNGYVASDDWKKESGSGALLTWWIFWAVTHFIVWIISKQLIRTAFRDDITIPQAIGLTELQGWLCMFSLVIAGLWFWVANLLTQRMLDRSAIPANSQAVQNDIRTSNPAPVSRPSATLTPAAMETLSITPNNRREAANDIPEVAPSRLTIPIPAMPESDDWAFEKVVAELETSTTDKVLWTRVFAESGGDENKTKALYIQRRVNILVEAEKKRLAEEHAQIIEEKRRRDVQAELVHLRELKAQQEKEKRCREAELRNAAERERVGADEKDRQPEEAAHHQQNQKDAALEALDKVASAYNPPRQGMSFGTMFMVALGILAVALVAIVSSAPPEKPAAKSAANNFSSMSVADLQAKAATDPTAAFLLMLNYKLGVAGVSKNLAESLRWGEVAAIAGHARAQAMVGWYYTAGLGVPADKQKGLMWLEKAAAQNDPMGLSNLGWRYQIGDGVPLDYQKAFEYAKRASDLGDSVGRNNLAELYEKGHGVPKDYAKALELFEPLAAKASLIDSVLGMIRIYADQSGNYYYPVLAYAWLRVALDKLSDREELEPHLNELLALKQALEARLSPEQIETGRVKSANWKKGDYFRP